MHPSKGVCYLLTYLRPPLRPVRLLAAAPLRACAAPVREARSSHTVAYRIVLFTFVGSERRDKGCARVFARRNTLCFKAHRAM